MTVNIRGQTHKGTTKLKAPQYLCPYEPKSLKYLIYSFKCSTLLGQRHRMELNDQRHLGKIEMMLADHRVTVIQLFCL